MSISLKSFESDSFGKKKNSKKEIFRISIDLTSKNMDILVQ